MSNGRQDVGTFEGAAGGGGTVRAGENVRRESGGVAKGEATLETHVGTSEENFFGKLALPCDDEGQWSFVEQVLRGKPVESFADLDAVLTKFSAEHDRDPRVATFFSTVPGTKEAGMFDFDVFFTFGLPLMLEVALEMPRLFEATALPIFKMRSSWAGPQILGKINFSLTRRQCACLLAHSFFGSLRRPAGVLPNDFRFTVVDLFMGTAVSPNSATTFLNYWNVLGKHGIPEGLVTFHRQGYQRGQPPWQWEDNDKPLCAVEIVDGSIDDCPADLHVEFANAFVGGGVMTGDAAMEEMMFLMQPELMVAMALQNRMVDEEAICVSGARKYSRTSGFGQSFTFTGAATNCAHEGPLPKICAVDAVRGGGPAMTETAMLRDMNKARIAFDGAREVATGHWGCGAFGNNHDLMFLKQWLAASDAGALKMFYHDYDRKQSHHISPLIRRLRHMTVGQLWGFLLELTGDLRHPHNMAGFCARVADISTGKIKVPVDVGKGLLSTTMSALATSSAGSGASSAGAEPVAIPEAQAANGSPAAVFPLAELRRGTPAGVEPAKKEMHLSGDDFLAIFRVPRGEFVKLPKWKRDAAKKTAGLF